MSSLSRELVFLILQFLDEEKFKETVHKLEQESGFYFNMKYFEDEVHNGNWDEVEKYLSGFTKVDDNRYSMKIFFEIRKQKYLEALDKHDRAKAVEILVKDLKVFASFNEELFKEITQLLTLENFRENEQLSKYGDTKSARAIMLVELKKLIEANPLFRDKLQFPSLKNSRLRTLINQSLNWQHQLCKNPKPNPDIKTLFVDHSCGQPNGARAPSPATNPLLGSIPKAGFPPLGAHGPFQTAPAPVPTPLAGWMSNPPAVTHPAVSGGAIGLGGPSNPAALLKHSRTPPPNSCLDYPSADSEHVSKRPRPMGMSDEVNLPVNIMSVTYPQNHNQAMYSPDDLPKTVARTLNQGSTPMSMDFHPIQQTILLVGTNVGDIGLWDVGTRERLVLKNFKVWELGACSVSLQTALVKDPAVSVNRIIWSPDGSMFGVAYSRHIVQIYSYHGGDDIRQHLEIDAHVGGVNDIAFSSPNKQLCVVTCGDDKTIKVWDATTGTRRYTFEGHEAPVYSVCPHYKENIQFIFSTALDGKIKAWLYDNLGSRVDYDAPGHWCTTMAYSADGTRLFSCGTSKEGESFIVEWNESEGAVKRTYQGFRKRSLGVVQFDTTRNRFLAAGDEFLIKLWDMDNINLLTTIDAEGGLLASSRIRFNKEGTLLAVSTHDNGIKILANADGLRLLRTLESRQFDASRGVSEAVTKPIINTLSSVNAASSSGVTDRAASTVAITAMNGENRNLIDVKPRITDESMDKSKIWKLTEINEPAQCRSLRLMDNLRPTKPPPPPRSLLRTLSPLRSFATDADEYSKRNYANNVTEYSTVIGSLIAQRRGFLLRDVYDDMMLDGVQPLRDTFHSLIVGTMKGSRLQDAFFFRDEMKANGLPPDVNLYNFLISTCGKCKNSDVAIKLLEEMKKFGVKPKGETYICLLNTCAATGRTGQVFSIIRDMTAAGLGLNKFCYAGLVTAIKNKLPTTDETTSKIIEYVKQSKGWTSPEASTDGGENLMMNVSEEELYNIPTAEFVHRRAFVNKQLTVYHVAVHACAELKSKETLETLLDMLKQEGLNYDGFVAMQAIRCYFHCGDIDSAVKIFEEYTSSKPPSAELYTTFIEGAMIGYTPRGMKIAQYALEQLSTRGFFLNARMGSDLLLAAAGEKEGGYTTANYIWDMMQTRNLTPFLPAVETYYEGLKEREIPADDPRLLHVGRTYDNVMLRFGRRQNT